MKVSIITVVFNNEKTIAHAIESVLLQSYFQNIEYIVIDGNSGDATLEIIHRYQGKIARIISEPDKGLYDAINKGIRMATGDVVGILNSDDFFASPDIVSVIADSFAKYDIDALFADVAFVRPARTDYIVRLYSSEKFKVQKFAKGYMPAHPSFYVKREMYLRCGFYKTDYTIAADYEMMIRLLYTNRIKYMYVPKVFVYMRTGGVSNKNAYSIYLLNKEIVRACRENNIRTNMALLSLKYFTKIFEYVLPNSKKKPG